MNAKPKRKTAGKTKSKASSRKKPAPPAEQKAIPATKRSTPPASARPITRSADSLAPFMDLLTLWQIKYLQDRSRLKKLEKSRRIGGTWIQALEDVLDATEQDGLKIWFSSADKTAGTEYIDYVLMWVGVANLLVQTIDVSESQIDELEFDTKESLEVADEEDATATVVTFHNGSKITALSSNPSQFRSKGGKVVLDEFAHHKRDRDLWKAAQPVAARGHSIRVLSTHNGKSCAFYKLGNKERGSEKSNARLAGNYGWSNHCVTLEQAVAEGMLDQIEGRHTTQAERDAFIASIRAQCLNQAQYDEEYRCIPQDEAHALLTYAAIESVERDGILGLHQARGPLYLGFDIARRRHLSVIYVLELCGTVLHTRHLVVMEKQSFATQKGILWPLLKLPNLVRASIDATGIGMQLAEEAQEAFGTYRVEAVTFTSTIKDALATRIVQEVEDSATLIPVDAVQKESLHSIQRTVSAANTPRYDAAADEENGHGDHFWALALAINAARTGDNANTDVDYTPTRETATTSESFGIDHGHLDSWATFR